MKLCLFVSDLHGKISRYSSLFKEIKRAQPSLVIFGGDLLPFHLKKHKADGGIFDDFILDYLIPHFSNLRESMKEMYPEVFLILGNDDPREDEKSVLEGEDRGLWSYIHQRKVKFDRYTFHGYSFVPPTPFRIKDWEKYDVSRYVDPGCIAPMEGFRTADPDYDPEYSTIQKDLQLMATDQDHSASVFIFHSPPYQTLLDRAALDGKMVDHVPLDVHVGSIAIRRFIEISQPYLTLHGHIHESSAITGNWRDNIGKTHLFSGAYDGPELAVVKFDLDDLKGAVRVIC